MRSIIRLLAWVSLLVGLVATPVLAEDITAGALVVSQGWSRATPGGAKVGGGYLTIENKGSAPDRLVAASGEFAGRVEIHEMAVKDGVMTMRPLEKGVLIEPGKTVKLAPGGYHLMLFDLKNALKQGDKLPLTLEFETAGKVAIFLDVQGVGAPGPAPRSDGKPDQSGMKK